MAATITADKSKDTASENSVKTLASTPGISKELINELSNEINNMLSYAVYNGITINTEINSLIQNSSVDDLINAHNLLCKNVAPATPKSIEFTKQLNQKDKNRSLFKKLPLLRNLVLLSIFFLLLLSLPGYLQM